MSMRPRSQRQREILDFITDFFDDNGYEPTYQAIADEFGLNSRSGILKHIVELETKGLIMRSRESGTFRLVLPNRTESSICMLDWIDGSDERDVAAGPLAVSSNIIGHEPADGFCVMRMQDDAMADMNIESDDIIIIERRTFVRDKTCIAARTEEDGLVLRRFFKKSGKVELLAGNEDYEPIVLPADNVEIIGLFRSLLRF
jgi:repressor LexA